MKHSILLFSCIFLISITNAQNSDKLLKFYSEKKFEETINLGLKQLEKYPGNPYISSIVGRSYADLNQFQNAIPFLEKGATIENGPDGVKAWSYGYLGRCYYFTNNVQKSKECLEKCISLRATENSVRYGKNHLESFQISDFYGSWETLETEHFIFHFQNANNLSSKEQFTKDREDAYTQINKFFNAKPYKKIDFYVWDKPEQAKEKLGRELGFANSYSCIINSRNNQTRGHEITHILCNIGMEANNQTKLISEGIAVYFDQTNRDRYEIAKESIRGKEIDLIDLWKNKNPFPEEYFYTVGPALIAYLFENGTEDQIKQLLKDQSLESAKRVYPNFNELMNSFNKKLKE